MRVCGLAWNSGGAGIRSVAVGLHDVLGVGELVELVDVGLGTMTSMVENIAGSSWDRVFNRVFLLGEVGGSPGGSRARSVPTRVASARPA